jgi:hypothetical protein
VRSTCYNIPVVSSRQFYAVCMFVVAVGTFSIQSIRIPIHHSCLDFSTDNFGVCQPPKQSLHKLLLRIQGCIAFLPTLHDVVDRFAIVGCFPEMSTTSS